MACASQWYEFYYDILKWPGGQYWSKINEMHERYEFPDEGVRLLTDHCIKKGPIVRITPYEVHIKDSEWYGRLYCAAGQGDRDKYPPSAHMTGTPLGVFGTVGHETHRKRRAAINAFFSKRAVSDIEPWIHDKANALCAAMRDQQARGSSVELRVNFLAMTTDLIAAHTLNGSNQDRTLDLLKNNDNARDWQKTIAALAVLTPLCKQAPWLIPFALKLSVGFWMMIAPPLGRVVRLNRNMRSSAQATIDEEHSDSNGQLEPEKADQSTKRHNVFHTILHSSLPPEEKTSKRLGQEGFVAIAAGGETCGRMLTIAIYHILANKDRVMPMLTRELLGVMPTPDARPELKALEQLPWLTAVIRETLRLGAILTSRLPLVARNEALQYQSFVIPPGHPVSMSLRHILHDPNIFHDPLGFRPERWLEDNPDLARIKKFYVPFSPGTRNCIGINLAYAQVYIVLASVLRRFDLSLHDVVYERDIEAVRDCFIGEPQLNSPGVRVIVKDVVA